MKIVNWTLSCSHKEDRARIDLLCRRGELVRMTTVLGVPVCWEYQLEGARLRETGEPVLIKAFVSSHSA